MARASVHRELNAWLAHHGYHHSSAERHSRVSGDRAIHQEPTSRAAHERDHHITTAGRRALHHDQFALPPGPEERRRGIKGRLPIDSIMRARNALTRASMMRNRGTLSAKDLAKVRRAVHRAWPSIEIDAS